MNQKQFLQNHHHYQGDYEGHFLSCARYNNAAGFALAVVASVHFSPDGQLRDWAAYWHGCNITHREEDAVRWVAEHGCKLSRKDAAHFFPGFPMSHYRG